MQINFDPLTIKDFKLMHLWFNKPHVQEFYSLRSWTFDDVVYKLAPYVKSDSKVHGFLVNLDQEPFAYIQYYKYSDFPYSNLTMDYCAGIDLFIGDSTFLHKGLGKKLLNGFLSDVIWPKFDYALVDPDLRNQKSIVFFKKCGFQDYRAIKTQDGLKRRVTLQLMIASKKQISNPLISLEQKCK